MNSWGSFATAMTLSIAIHAAVGASSALSDFWSGTREVRSIQVESVSRSEPSEVLKPAPIVYPKPAAPTKPMKKISAEKRPDEKWEEQRKNKLRKEVGEEIKRFSRPAHASDFASDPVAGKVFSSYYTDIKRKIQTELKSGGAFDGRRTGVVSVVFVVKPDGSLKDVMVQDRESSDGNRLRDDVVDAIKKSSPFGRFPEVLRSSDIAFNLKIYFNSH